MNEVKWDAELSQIIPDDSEWGTALKTALAGRTTKLVARADDQTTKQALGKRLHDIVGAVRVLRFVYEALEDGYQFNDAQREAKLASLNRAVTTIERESKLLEQVLS